MPQRYPSLANPPFGYWIRAIPGRVLDRDLAGSRSHRLRHLEHPRPFRVALLLSLNVLFKRRGDLAANMKCCGLLGSRRKNTVGHRRVISCEFAQLFGSVPGALRPYVPSLRHALVDLAQIDDRALSGQARLRAFLKALKYSRRQDLPQRIDILLAEAPMLEETDLVLILTYLDKGPRAVSDTLLRETLQRLVPEQTERIMGWLTQPYFDKGKAEGRAEGRVQGRTEGRAEGEAKVLVRLIEKRFGGVPPQLRERILAADLAALEEWVERVLDAPDLQSVFGSN
jgi:hypothetical protein